MKTSFNKILTVITAVTFVAALTLNIQASLSDPFAGMSDEAVALTTSEGETTGTDGYEMSDYKGSCSCILCEPEPEQQCNVSAQCCLCCEPFCPL